MSEINRLAQKQENAVYELFNTYQQEYKQDPGHIAKVLNEVNAERLKPIQPITTAEESFDLWKHIQQDNLIGNMCYRAGQSLRSFGEEVGLIKDPPNPFQMARMDREAALIELSIASVKIANHDGPGAAILRNDATAKREEAQRLDPEVQTDCALTMLDFSLGQRLPKQAYPEQQIQNPFSRR